MPSTAPRWHPIQAVNAYGIHQGRPCEPSSGLGSPHSVSRFVYFVTLIPSNTVDFGARQTNQS